MGGLDTRLEISVSYPLHLDDTQRERTERFTGRGWVLDRLDGWMAGTDPKFLLTGPPGTGKSAIAVRLVQMSRGEVPSGRAHLSKGCIDLAQFCRAQGDDASLNPLRFVERLSGYLASLDEGFRQQLLDQSGRTYTIEGQAEAGVAHEQAVVAGVVVRVQVHDLSPRLAFDETVRRPLEAIGGVGAQVTVLVDALDEALGFGSDDLVDLLRHVSANPLPGLRFLLTARSEEPEVVDPRRLGPPDLDLIKNAPEDVDDVADYAHGRLETLPEPSRTEVAAKVAEAGRGNFLYAHYVVGDLLALEEPGDIDPSTLKLPAGLEGHYREFLDRELLADDRDWRDLYRPVLGLLAVARGDGLTDSNVAGGSGLDRERARDALRVCRQYLTGPNADGSYRIYHHSFREFLLADPSTRIDPAVQDERLADYLIAQYGEDWGSCTDAYALAFTPAHLVEAIRRQGDGKRRQKLTSALSDLLTDFGFLEQKTAVVGVDLLLADFSEALEHFQTRAVGDLGLSDSDSPSDEVDLPLVQETIRQSAPVLASDPGQLASQLLGRLVRSPAGRISQMLLGAASWDARPWLRPLNASLMPAGGPLRFTLRGHQGTPKSIAISADGQLAVSLGPSTPDRTLRFWNLKVGVNLGVVPWEHFGPVRITDDRWAVTSEGETLHVWDLQTGQRRATLPGHIGGVRDLAAAAEAPRLVAAAGSSMIVWDTTDWTVRLEIPEGPSGVAVAADGRMAVSVSPVNSWDGIPTVLSYGEATDETSPASLKLWDLETGAILASFEEDEQIRQGNLAVLAVNSDGTRAFLSSYDGMRVWDVRAGTVVPWVRLSMGGMLAASADGSRALALRSSGGSPGIVAWDSSRGDLMADLGIEEQAVVTATITPDGRRALVAMFDHNLQVWDLDRLDWTVSQGPSGSSRGRVDKIAVLVDGKRAVSHHWGGVSAVWSLEDGSELSSSDQAGRRSLQEVRLGEQERQAIEARANRLLRERIEATWEEPRSRKQAVGAHSDERVAISPDGLRALHTSMPRRKSSAHTELEEPLGTPSGDRRISSPITVYDLADPTEPRILLGHTYAVTAMAFFSDGSRAVSGGYGRVVRIWDLDQGTQLRELQGHKGTILSLAVSTDDRLVVSASEDATLRVWEAESGDLVATFSGDVAMTACSVVSDDGTIVAGDASGAVHVLSLVAGRHRSA